MAAQLKFYAGSDNEIPTGSGLGFYGGTFGASVRVGEYNQTTYITNPAGTAQGAAADNIKYSNIASGIVNSATGAIFLRNIPNQEATLNIRFTYDTAVNVQNVTVKIYDRTTTTSAATGVTTFVSELIHFGTSQASALGSGGATWMVFSGSSVSANQSLTLAVSPGISGFAAGNGSASTHVDTRHDWYLALSASPDSIGSKQLYGLYASLEYL
jgi:hypothetical protein